ncbi:unnamed protein product [Clavelina lepadiformis]|uniref:Serine aminopeptidase S33 domain-containing protein n=1 Tax=Clavelina lepadiformis TaxID=159417 RepID=A0ABP0H321_CLALP
MATSRHTYSGKLFSEVDSIVNADGQYLFCKYWKPTTEPRFLVLMLHGLGGHCARFNELALNLNEIGGLCFANDYVGHGESEGDRTTVNDYKVFIRDAFQHANKTKEEYPNLPVFLYGQSMGGALALLASSEKEDLFQGVIILGGMLKIDPGLASPFKKFIVRSVGNVFPNLQVSSLDQSLGSRDKNEVDGVLKDTLSSSGIKAQMAAQIVKICEAVERIIPNYNKPFLALHGSADGQCDPAGSQTLYQNAKSDDKILKIYPGCYHDLIHELKEDRQKSIKDIVDWINDRLNS